MVALLAYNSYTAVSISVEASDFLVLRAGGDHE